MQIEVAGRETVLEELRLHLEDQLEKFGYKEGPKFSSMDAGVLIDYVKGDRIISIQITQESEAGESLLRVRSQQEVPELNEIWDAALVNYGKEVLSKLRSFAIDKKKVDQELG